MESVAGRDEVTIQTTGPATPATSQPWPPSIDTVNGDILRIVDDRFAGGVPCRVEISCQLGLSVDYDESSTRETREIDMCAAVSMGEPEPGVNLAFALQAFADSCAAQHVRETRFKHTGPHATEHVTPRPALENHALDPMDMQNLAKEQPGGSSADNSHLRSQSFGQGYALPCGGDAIRIEWQPPFLVAC